MSHARSLRPNVNALWVAALLVSASPIAAHAQAATAAHLQRGPTVPAFSETSEAGEDDARLQAADASGASDRLASGLSFQVREIRVRGVTAIDDSVVQSLVAPYLGHAMNTEDVIALRQAITLAYVERGYFSSGALVEDQDVSDGILDVQVIEGRLGAIEVSGLGRTGTGGLGAAYIQRAFRDLRDRPLDAAALQLAFRRLSNDPIIARIQGDVTPGDELGVSTLRLNVVPEDPSFLSAEIANDRSPSVGSLRASLTGGLRNLIGYGDVHTLTVSESDGGYDAVLQSGLPLPWRRAQLNLYAAQSDTEVVEAPFSALDVLTDSTLYGASLSVPVIEKSGSSLALTGHLDRVETQTTLLGLDLSLSPGAQSGRTEYTVFRFSQDYAMTGARHVLALRSTFNLGLDAIEPDFANKFTPPEDFFAWTGQVRHGLRTGTSGRQLISQLDARLTKDPAFATEKLALGGPASLRGYRQNTLVTDAGFVAGVEYQVPATDLGFSSTATLFGALYARDVRVGPFVDTGFGWNASQKVQDGEWLSSVGIGLEWRSASRFSARIDAGVRLNNTPDVSDETLQDYGVTFRLKADIF